MDAFLDLTVKGGFPWKPSLDAELVEVLHRYDMPLVGLIGYRGQSFLFQCVEGQVGKWSLWTYHRIDAEAEEGLLSAEPLIFNKVLRYIVGADRSFLVALSSLSGGIRQHGLVEHRLHSESVIDDAAEALHMAPSDLHGLLGVIST
jgi:hypothetical protein